MQAIILAAGMGRRLGELTKKNTKCMVEVNGIPLVDRLLEQLCSLNLNRIVFVIGYEGEKLQSYIDARYKRSIQIEYVSNPVYDKTNNIYSLALAKKYLQEDDTLLIESDLIFEEKLFSLIVENPYPNLALVAKYETWMDGTMVRIDDDNNIINFVPKKAFKYSDVGSYYKTVNIYKFSKAFSTQKYVPFLDAYCKALGNNEYYEQVLRVITFLDKSELKALPIGGEKWYEIDDIQDLDIAEALFAEGETRFNKYRQREGGYWRFPGLLNFYEPVSAYFPSGRMLDELQANFNILLTTASSHLNVNTLLAGKYFDVSQDYIVPVNELTESIEVLMENSKGDIGVIGHPDMECPFYNDRESLRFFVPTNPNFKYSVDELITYFSSNPISTLLLMNPDDLAGNFISLEELCTLAGWCEKQHIRLIVDESFMSFTYDITTSTLLHNDLLEQYPHMVVAKKISQTDGIPGLQLGILASSDMELITWIRKKNSMRKFNSFAEFYMQIYSKYEADYERACKRNQEERESLYVSLQTIPFLRVIPSESNYLLCEVLSPYTAKQLAVTLLHQFNILVKNYGVRTDAKIRHYIRVAVRTKEDNRCLIDALKELR